jgi:hypothetical protein
MFQHLLSEISAFRHAGGPLRGHADAPGHRGFPPRKIICLILARIDPLLSLSLAARQFSIER